MARINLSIPDDLRTRMSALDDRFNWSEVAQAAFERELLSATFDGENMNSVIERLRASKEDHEKEEREGGHSHGVDWAKNSASYAELKKIAKIWSDVDDGILGYDDDEETALALAVDRRLKNDPRRDPESSFWYEDDGRLELPTNAYVLAFLEGAADVWEEVEEKI